MTIKEMQAYASRYKVFNCPICGAKASIIVGGTDDEAIAVVCCSSRDAADGGYTNCGARLDAAVGEDALAMQVMRWNKATRLITTNLCYHSI